MDGEGWDGKYTLLSMSSLPYDAYNVDGLSTVDCLNYLTDHDIPSNMAFVGFGLSYDYENILRDLPEEDYLKLKDGEKIRYDNFVISYIPRKILEVTLLTGKADDKGKHITKTVFIQDVFGFFQSSFIASLEKWNIEIPEIIHKGKAMRGDEFGPENIEFIKAYNREELRLLIELMERLRDADKKAFDLIGLRPTHGPRIWFGPGSRARTFLNQTNYINQHPPFSGKIFKDLQKKVIKATKEFPFASAFYGGRIESAMIGEYRGRLYDYDINSAYPYAISLLPKWGPEDLVKVIGLDKKHRIGMYYIEWDLSEGINFYPFPFRGPNDNVFFPRRGSGWYMSPEVEAAKKIYPYGIRVKYGYVLENTDGGGDATKRLNDEKLCDTALKVREMATIRLEAKKNKMPAEKVLKLILNSCYGKTIQQVGSHKFLNPFIAAWITSVCRAKIISLIGQDRKNKIISIMTDGILTSRKFINPDIGPNLGQLDVTEFDRVIQFMPGVYYLENEKTGEKVSRYRGMDKDFSPQKALAYLKGNKKYKIKMKIFVTRSLAIHQYNAYGDKIYYFVDVEKAEEFRLSSKRYDPKGTFKLKKEESFSFFPPKEIDIILAEIGSKPYVLDVDPLEKNYDSAKTLEELTDDRHISSILKDIESMR